jgi:hypothetical protein
MLRSSLKSDVEKAKVQRDFLSTQVQQGDSAGHMFTYSIMFLPGKRLMSLLPIPSAAEVLKMA